jgi:hypothetical protein
MFQRRERSTWLKCRTDLSWTKPEEAERGEVVEENEFGVIGPYRELRAPASMLGALLDCSR